MSSKMREESAKLFPIIRGHRVLRLGGGNPCFQSASSKLFVIVRPELLVF